MNQIRRGLALILVASLAATGSLRGQSPSDVEDAALRLKQGKILRTLQACNDAGKPENQCKQLLELIHKREVQVMGRLAPALNDPAVNHDEVARELGACYSPNYDYPQLVECQSQLADRLAAARKGQFLLKR